MLCAPMASPKKTTKKPSTKAATKTKGLTFAEAGRRAAKAAQRELLLKTLDELNWNLTKTADALAMGARGNVIRALRELAPEEYERAKADERVKPGVRPEK